MNRPDALMVDIETMGTTPDAAVVAIGACMFDPYAGPDQEIQDYDTFLIRISLDSNETIGRKIAAGTVMWWLQQSPDAQQNLLSDQTSLPSALANFVKWLQHETSMRPDSIWANDPDFDLTILSSAARDCKIFWPLNFWMYRSVRTVGALAYPDHQERKAVIKLFREAAGTHHRADHDAIAQARFIAHCYEELRHGNIQRP